MAIQYILAVLIVLALSRIYFQYRKKNVTAIELFFWFVFWTSSLIVVFRPETTTYLAQRVGVGRGADLVIYIALIAIFYSIFRMFVKIRNIEHDVSRIVTEIALSKKREED